MGQHKSIVNQITSKVNYNQLQTIFIGIALTRDSGLINPDVTAPHNPNPNARDDVDVQTLMQIKIPTDAHHLRFL